MNLNNTIQNLQGEYLPLNIMRFHKIMIVIDSNYLNLYLNDKQKTLNMVQLYKSFDTEQKKILRIKMCYLHNINNKIISWGWFEKKYHNIFQLPKLNINNNQLINFIKDMINDKSENIKYFIFTNFVKDINILPDDIMMIMINYL
jgi:hypothetical protein